MPLSFKLPTTSFLTLQDFLTSGTHPSLPVAATSQRSVVRQALKEHKRLSDASKPAHLQDVLASMNGYVPYLLALDAGLGGRDVAGDEVQVDLKNEVQVEWRPTLTSTVGGRELPRVKLKNFEYEVLFTLSTLAMTHYLIGRNHLHVLYNTVTPSPEQKLAAVSAAGKHFAEANKIFSALLSRANQLIENPPVPDIAWSTFEALASISRAETTLAAVLRNDPYPSAVIQSRNTNDNEWMIKAPDIPKVKVQVSVRLAMAASESAAKAQSTLARSKEVSSTLTDYADDLKRTARGKACRFLALDCDIAGKTGEAIAWLHAARKELGFTPSDTSQVKVSKVFSKFKKDLSEKSEDRKMEKGKDWGSDAGKFEEGRVVDMLMSKWTQMNNTINVQTIPPWEPLLSQLPSGRDLDPPKPWVPPALDENGLTRMRAPVEFEAESVSQAADDDSDDDNVEAPRPVGAFPESDNDVTSKSTYY